MIIGNNVGFNPTSMQAHRSLQEINTTSQKSAGSDLRNQFMTLLTAQIKNQDPTEPLKPQEQIAQLAQLTQVEQTEKQTAILTGILNGMGQINQASPLDLLNRTVNADFNGFSLAGKADIDLKINAPLISQQGGTVKILVTDQNNRIVKSIDVSKDDASSPINWDGKDNLGSPLIGGVYSIHAEQTINGFTKKIGVTTTGKVESIDVKNGGLVRLDNGMTISTGSVISVNSKE